MLKRQIEDTRFWSSNLAIGAMGATLAGAILTVEGILQKHPPFVLVGVGFALPSAGIAVALRQSANTCNRFETFLHQHDRDLETARLRGKQQCEASHPDLIQTALNRADANYRDQLRTATTEARNIGYQDGQANTRQQVEREYRAKIDKLTETLSDLQREHAATLQRQKNEMTRQREKAIADLQQQNATDRDELTRQHREAIARLEKTHAAEISELEAQIGERQQEIEQWEQRKSDIDHDLAAIQEWRVEMARHEGKIAQMESERMTFDMRISQVEEASQAKVAELFECIAEEREVGYQAGYKTASDEFETERRQLLLDLQRWQLRAEKREQKESIEKSLATVKDAIGNDLKPLLLAGEPGAGKGTTAITLASEVYANNAGVVILAYDPSEGGDEDSTWSLSGVPSFRDPHICLDLLRALAANMDSYTMRTNAEKYDATPAIIFVCDELQTALMGLNKDERDEFSQCFTRLHTAGHKRKVFLFVSNQSHQVQNMKCGSTQLLNGGQLGNFHRLYFNKILDKFLEEKGESVVKDEHLQSYLEAYEGRYRLAMVKSSQGSAKLQPIKHPSHHGRKLGEKKPARPISNPKLAPLPAWMPLEIKAIYRQWFQGDVTPSPHHHHPPSPHHHHAITPGDGDTQGEPLKPALRLVVSDGDASGNRGSTGSDLGFSESEVFALREAIESGLNQQKSIELALEIPKGGTKKWKRAAELYNRLKSEIKK